MKIIRNKQEYVVDTTNCKDAVNTTTQEGILETIEIVRENETLMFLDVKRSCLGIIKETLKLYDIKVGQDSTEYKNQFLRDDIKQLIVYDEKTKEAIAMITEGLEEPATFSKDTFVLRVLFKKSD